MDERAHTLPNTHIFWSFIQNDLYEAFFFFESLFFLSKTMKNKYKIFSA